jgi:hypothetical protein
MKTASDKSEGHKFGIPDSLFLRLQLEAYRRGMTLSQLATELFDRELPRNIKSVVEGEQETA